MDLGKQLEWQVKEKCGNRIVKVILERILVSGQKPTNKSNESYSSLKIGHENQEGNFRGASKLPIESGPGPSRPLRSKTKIYTHFFDGGNECSDDDKSEDTSDCESESSPLHKNKTRSKPPTNSKKPSTKMTKQDEGEPDIKMTCDICKINLKPVSIGKHYRRKHPNEKRPKLPSSPPKPRPRKTTGKYESNQIITCDFCPSSFTRSYMWRHLQIKHPEHLSKGDRDPSRTVKCDLCPSVLLRTQMYMHKKRHHSQTQQIKTIPCLKCDLCSNKFTSQKGLEYHILQVHVVDKPFECGICCKSYLTETKLNEHEKRAHKDKHFSCRYCPTKSFGDSASLKKHIQMVHKSYNDHCDAESIDSNLLCPLCDTWFFTDSDLVQHFKKPKSKSVMKCEVCSELVHTPCHLNLHRQKMHQDTPIAEAPKTHDKLEEPAPDVKQGPRLEKITETHASAENQVSTNTFSCAVCTAHFSRRCDLDLHELHEKHRRWKCPVCSKLVNKKSELKIHIQSVHSDARPFECTHPGCRKTFPVMKVLKKHIATHDTNRVHCKECSRYLTPAKFEAHVANYHEGKDQFKCHVCNSMWATQKRLLNHAVKHTDERPWPCKFCVATYKTEAESKRHMKKCEFWSKKQRMHFLQERNRGLLAAKTLKCKTSSNKCIGKGKAKKLQGALTPNGSEPIAKSNCTNDLNGITSFSGADLKIAKQEMDSMNWEDNSVICELPVEGLVPVKLEKVPKQEI